MVENRAAARFYLASLAVVEESVAKATESQAFGLLKVVENRAAARFYLASLAQVEVTVASRLIARLRRAQWSKMRLRAHFISLRSR